MKPEQIVKFKEFMAAKTKGMESVVQIISRLFSDKEMNEIVEIFDNEEEYFMAVQY